MIDRQQVNKQVMMTHPSLSPSFSFPPLAGRCHRPPSRGRVLELAPCYGQAWKRQAHRGLEGSAAATRRYLYLRLFKGLICCAIQTISTVSGSKRLVGRGPHLLRRPLSSVADIRLIPGSRGGPVGPLTSVRHFRPHKGPDPHPSPVELRGEAGVRDRVQAVPDSAPPNSPGLTGARAL